MLFDMLADKENAMEVVGHKLKGNDGDFRVVAWDAAPLFADCHPKRRRHYMWRLLTAEGLARVADNGAEEGLASFCSHCYHIHPPRLVVVVLLPPFHRRFLRTGQFYLPP